MMNNRYCLIAAINLTSIILGIDSGMGQESDPRTGANDTGMIPLELTEVLQYMNLSADPCNDFYEYACGNLKNMYDEKYKKSNHKNWNLAKKAEEDIQRELLDILENAGGATDSGHTLTQARNFYTACVNGDAYREAYGKQPLITLLNRYGGWVGSTDNTTCSDENQVGCVPQSEQIFQRFARLRKDLGMELWFMTSTHLMSDGPILYMYYPSAIASDIALHLFRIDRYVPKIEAFRAYLKVLIIALNGTESDFDDIYKLDDKIAKVILYSFPRNSEVLNIKTLIDNYGFIKWDYFLKQILQPLVEPSKFNKKFMVRKYLLSNLSTIFTPELESMEGRRKLQNYMMAYVADKMVDYLDSETRQAKEEFRVTFDGVTNPLPKKDRCFDMVRAFLGNELDFQYIDRHNGSINYTEVSDLAAQILRNIPSVSRDLFIDLPMDVIDQIESIRILIGQPASNNRTIHDIIYRNLNFSATDYFGNILNNRNHIITSNILLLENPGLLSTSWGTLTKIVTNYDLTTNELRIYFGNLEKGFYRPNSVGQSSFYNHGGVGTYITRIILKWLIRSRLPIKSNVSRCFALRNDIPPTKTMWHSTIIKVLIKTLKDASPPMNASNPSFYNVSGTILTQEQLMLVRYLQMSCPVNNHVTNVEHQSILEAMRVTSEHATAFSCAATDDMNTLPKCL